MIDIPENDIRQRMDPIGLVRFVNVLKGKKVTNSTDVESKYGSKKLIDKNSKDSNNTKEDDNKDDEDLVNYKVGRLVMSILKEFQVSALLEKFEKVLVENVDIDEEDSETHDTTKLENDLGINEKSTTSYNKKNYSKKKKSNYSNHRGIYILHHE